VAVIIKCRCKKKGAGALRKAHLLLHFLPLFSSVNWRCVIIHASVAPLGVAHLSPFPSTRLVYIFVSYIQTRGLFQMLMTCLSKKGKKKKDKYISNSSIIVVVYIHREPCIANDDQSQWGPVIAAVISCSLLSPSHRIHSPNNSHKMIVLV
jgi:hypothetical protein